MNTPKPKVQESSISRINDHLNGHDCGFISAERNKTDCNRGEQITYDQNLSRTRKLYAILRTKGYGVTKVKGSYIEAYGSPNAHEVSETSFFVTDLNDLGDLKETLISLGEAFEQDSILYSEVGGKNVQLIGVSDCDNAYPSRGESVSQGSITGDPSQFFSRIGSRQLSFHEIAEPGVYGRAGRSQLAKIYAEELNLPDLFPKKLKQS